MKKLLAAAAAALSLAACVSIEANEAPAAAAPSQTEVTRGIVTPFSDLFCNQGKVREAFMTHVAPGYIQHNPVAADGRDTAIAALEGFRAASPQMTCEVKRIIVDGNLAAVHSHVKPTPEHRGFAVVDILRVENGMIVEHWDVIQPVPETSRNNNTMF
ncbi:MAG: nuclear transport factor 2 family protein [Hyphomonadaceae bacterium]|nr:nuclear transport factor 2 family protein [Hyphomonadaceae bacterium]